MISSFFYKLLTGLIVSVLLSSQVLAQRDSPFGSYSIYRKDIRHQAERTIENQYSLVDLKSGDTTFVASNFRHSESNPIPYWSSDGNFLIMENSTDADVPVSLHPNKRWHEVSSIVIWNLSENRQEERIEGFLITRSRHYNSKDNTLIYYSVTGQGLERQSHVMAYDLNSFSSQKIFTLACFKNFHYPTLKFVDGERKFKLSYVCSNYPENEKYTEVLSY